MYYNVTLRRVLATVFFFAVEKVINITYSDRMFIALGFQHAMRMLHIVSCGLSGSTVFSSII